MDDQTRTELEAAVYRRLVEHLRQRTDVQNIDLMNLAGFCRNCLSNWMKDAADAKGLAMTKDERFLAEAQKLSLDVSPSTGESVQEFVTRIYASPKAIVDRAKDALRLD